LVFKLKKIKIPNITNLFIKWVFPKKSNLGEKL
jgi:hypothetical protein